MFLWGNIMRMFWVLVVMLSALSSPAVAEKKPVPLYPPYPDVWGQERPLMEGGVWVLGIPQADGDVGLLARTMPHEYADQFRGFFSGRDEEVLWDGFESQETKKWEDKYAGKYEQPFYTSSLRYNKFIFYDKNNDFYIGREGFKGMEMLKDGDGFHYYMGNFSDGSSNKELSIYKRWSCILGDFIHVLKNHQKDIAYKIIIRRRPRLETQGVGGAVMWLGIPAGLSYDDCHKKLPYDRYQSRVAIWRLASHPRLVLKDGTFLAVIHSALRADWAGEDEWNTRVVVRMRPDFTSPYLDQRDDVYIIDFARILPILKESELRAAADPSFNDAEFIFAQIDALIDTLPPKPASTKH